MGAHQRMDYWRRAGGRVCPQLDAFCPLVALRSSHARAMSYGVAGIDRMQSTRKRLHTATQRIVSRVHTGKERVATCCGHLAPIEYCNARWTFGKHLIGMPATTKVVLIRLRFDDLDNLGVSFKALDIGMEVNVTKALCKCQLLLRCYVLVPQEQHAVFQQLYVELLEVAVRKMGQVNAFEFRAQSAAGWMGFDVVFVIDLSLIHI